MIAGGKLVFADMGDAVNVLTVNTSQPQYPFDTPAMFTTTGVMSFASYKNQSW